MSKLNHLVHVMNIPEHLEILRNSAFSAPHYPSKLYSYIGIDLILGTAWYAYTPYHDPINTEQLEVLILLDQMQVPWELIVETIRSES